MRSDFDRIIDNDHFENDDYNAIILDNERIYVKCYSYFGQYKMDYRIERLPVKPKDILDYPIKGLITEDGFLVKVTDPDICKKIARVLIDEEYALSFVDEASLEETHDAVEKKRSTKNRKPCVDGWEVQCHRGKTPIYTKVVKEVAELIASEGMEVSIDKITDIVFAAYSGEITRVTAKSHAYRYREVCLEDIGPVKLTRGVKAGLTRLGYSSEKAIYKEVVDAITDHPERMIEIIMEIEKVLKSSAEVYAPRYKEWIAGHKPEQDSVEKAVPQSGESITDPDARESITLCYDPEAKLPKLTKIGSVDQKTIYKEVVDEIARELSSETPKRTISQIIEEFEGVSGKSANVYAVRYRKWIEDRELLPSTVLERAKLMKRDKYPDWVLLCYHNHTPIYDKILLEILRSQNSGPIFDMRDIIEKEYGESLKSTTSMKYAYDYQAFINLISIDEVKVIYVELPESFNISNVRAHISTRFGQSEKRAAVAKLAIAMLIALFNCEEVAEGSFRKEKGGGKRPLS